MNNSPKFAVIGGGSWATAIAKMLCVNQAEICWYMRNQNAIDHIKTEKHNPNYLSSVEFDTKKLKLTTDINEAVSYADILIFAIPSAFLDAELKNMTVSLADKIISDMLFTSNDCDSVYFTSFSGRKKTSHIGGNQ